MIEKAVDYLVNLISPKAGVERAKARMIMRKYAGAKSAHWTPNNADAVSGRYPRTINDEIDQSIEVMTQRVLALVRDFPVFAGAVTNTENFVVGDGFRPQVMVVGSDGEMNIDVSQAIEDAFVTWASDPNQVDFAGRKTFWEFTSLTERQEMEFGEFLLRKHAVKNKGIKGLQIQELEPSDLSSNRGTVAGIQTKGNKHIWRGVEYDPVSLRSTKYHITTNTDIFGAVTTIPVTADMIYHHFKPLRGKQLRGVTPFASCILMADMVQDYMQSELAAQNMASRFVAFCTSPQGTGNFGASDKAKVDEIFNKIAEAAEYTTVRYLPFGEEFEVNTQQRVPDGMISFSDLVLKYLAVAITLPFEIVSQNYSELNFSILKAKRNDFKQQLKPRWKRKIQHFCQPVFTDWLKYEMLINGGKNINRDREYLPLVEYLKNPARYNKVVWIPPGLQKIDPLKETQAEILQVMAGMKSIQRVIKEAGDDPDSILKEIVSWAQKLDEEGVILPGLSQIASSHSVLNMTNLIEAKEEEPQEPEEDGTD